MKSCIWLVLSTLGCAHGGAPIAALAPPSEAHESGLACAPLPALVPEPAVAPTVEVALAPGRHWLRGGECTPLDVDERSETLGPSGLELSREVGRGTAFFMVRDGSFVRAGFRTGALSFDRACAGPALSFTPRSGWSFAGVPLFDTRASCEAHACSEDGCYERVDDGDCADAVAASSARVRSVLAAPEEARLDTFDRFRRMGGPARRHGIAQVWRRGSGGCLPVQASREEEELELRFFEDLAGGRAETVERYAVAPLESSAVLLSSSTLYVATGGGVGSLGGRCATLAFGDGVFLLGNDDYFFTRRDCEASLPE